MAGPSKDTSADAAGVRLARGAARLLIGHGFGVLPEFPLNNRRRADLLALDAKGRITIVEVKSGRSDFVSDRKWPDYLAYCDRFYFAVPVGFPLEILPQGAGVIVADDFGGEILRPSPVFPLNGNRRRSLMLLFAHTAANRHHHAWAFSA